MTITATNVEPATTVLDSNKERYIASEQIEAGEIFYVNSSNQAVLASHGTQAGAGGGQGGTLYIAINSGEKSGQEVQGVKLGQITIGTHSQALGTRAYLSTNAGKCPGKVPLRFGTNDYHPQRKGDDPEYLGCALADNSA